jgi:hypothetical protein
MITAWVSEKTINEVLAFQHDKEAAWNAFKDNPTIKSLETDWGIKVEENGIDFIQIIFEPEIQKALAAAKVAEYNAHADRRTRTIKAETNVLVEKTEKKSETIELQHVRDRAKEIKDAVGLSPKDAMEVVQTERNKVTKQIIEYKGLEGAGGLPLIHIGGERMPQRRKEEQEKQEGEKVGAEEKQNRKTARRQLSVEEIENMPRKEKEAIIRQAAGEDVEEEG